MADVLIVLPTYNERDNLPTLIGMLLELPVDLGVIVVDDNSPDGTGALADDLAASNPARISVVHRSGKLGLGTAYLAGFREGLAHGAQYLMTMDADLSHHPRYIPDIVKASRARYDLVIGSRYVSGGGIADFPLSRRLLSSGANSFARLLLGLKAHDATAGFRCYRREVLESLPLDTIFSSGYSFLIEMLYLVQRADFSIGEIPIIFEDRKEGRSKISERVLYGTAPCLEADRRERWPRFRPDAWTALSRETLYQAVGPPNYHRMRL
jgi:glycosyltransferase involved in cell wall biosynthesis